MLEPATATATAVLPAIDQELRAVSQQVDELLQLARADAAGEDAPMRVESLFLDDVVMDELPRWQPEAQCRLMTLDYSALEESPVVGDASLLPRMVSILVDNAIRYGREGGTVRVRVRPDDGAVLLDVEDDGIGIPEHERSRIFDRFFRGDAARLKRPDGSGLGLAIAAWIVRQHHGTIIVTGGVPRGTLVQVRLPLARS
jgi:signal transduction histidine kinase